MARKVKVGIVLVGLAAIAFVVGAYSFKRIQQWKRVEWWLERAYFPFRGLVPPKNLYYRSYAEWSEAGKGIRDADKILVAMYRKSRDKDEKGRLLYAMGAVPTPATIGVLSEVFTSTTDNDLREGVLIYGLAPNIANRSVQEVLVSLIKSDRQPLMDRCWVLSELLRAGNEDAIAYGSVHGQELVSLAQASGVDPRYTDPLAGQVRGLGTTSRPLPGDVDK